jgi:YVTN family beta-propeller protein
VHVVDLSTNTQKALITGFVTNTVNSSISSASSGPNRLVVLPDCNEMYVGDRDSTIKVIDLSTNTVVANITTGSKKRADEFGYNTVTGTIVVTNPNEATPYVSIINVTSRAVTGKVIFPNATELE